MGNSQYRTEIKIMGKKNEGMDPCPLHDFLIGSGGSPTEDQCTASQP